MRLSNSSWVRYFRLYTNVTATAHTHPGHTAACKDTHLETGLHYVNHGVTINHESFADEEQSCLATVKTNRFFCIRGLGVERSARLAIQATASVPAQFQASVVAHRTLDEHLMKLSLDIGGHNGRSAFHLFRMPVDDALDLWRLRFKVPDQLQGSGVVYHAYVMHESSPCIAKVLREGGCLDPLQVWSCFQSVAGIPKADFFRA